MLVGRPDEELVWFKALADGTSNLVCIADQELRIIYLNPAGMAMVGRASEDPTALSLQDLHSPAAFASLEGVRANLPQSGKWEGPSELRHRDGRTIPAQQLLLAIQGAAGRPMVYATIVRDLTLHRRVEALQRSIQVMSAPIMQVWDGVLALPVIGMVDSARAAQMTQALLSAIVETRCRVAVLDLTGVDAVDTMTVQSLFRMASAAALLGSACVVSGISGSVAQTVSQLGIDLSGLMTFRTLQDALRYVLTADARSNLVR